MGRNALSHNEDLAITYELKAKEIFTYHKIDTMVAQTNLSLSFPYINKGQYLQADKLISEVFIIANKTKNEKMRSNANHRLGYRESSAGRMDKALAAYMKTYNYLKEKHKIHELGDIINRLGGTYMEIGDCATAMRYWRNYLFEVEKNKSDGLHIIPIKANMIECYLKESNFQKAKELSIEVINIRKKSNSSKSLSSAYAKLGNVFLLENQYEMALIYNDTAVYYANLFGNEKIKASIMLDRAKILEKQQNKKAAINNLNRALTSASKANSPLSEMEAYKKLSGIHFQLNNLELAYKFDQKSDSIYEKIHSSEVISSIKTLEKEIIEKTSNEKIKLLQLQNHLKAKSIEQEKSLNRINKLLLLVSTLFLVLFGYLIYQRTKNNKLLNEKNKAIEKALNANKMLVKEIHHRVKNNFQVVSSLLGIQSRFTHNKEVQDAILNSKIRIQAMSLLHQNLYKNENLKTISILKYFFDLFENLSSTYSLKNQNIHLESNITDIEIDFDQVITLGLIVNELATNAIKHAFVGKSTGHIFLTIKESNNYLFCTFSDDGIGIPFTELPEKSTTMGMQLIQIFIHKLEAKIKIENNQGTQFNLNFKIEK